MMYLFQISLDRTLTSIVNVPKIGLRLDYLAEVSEDLRSKQD